MRRGVSRAGLNGVALLAKWSVSRQKSFLVHTSSEVLGRSTSFSTVRLAALPAEPYTKRVLSMPRVLPAVVVAVMLPPVVLLVAARLLAGLLEV